MKGIQTKKEGATPDPSMRRGTGDSAAKIGFY
jgi:hypothetical protein